MAITVTRLEFKGSITGVILGLVLLFVSATAMPGLRGLGSRQAKNAQINILAGHDLSPGLPSKGHGPTPMLLPISILFRFEIVLCHNIVVSALTQIVSVSGPKFTWPILGPPPAAEQFI